jgi:F-type H+-transporting ATPase subunit delta
VTAALPATISKEVRHLVIALAHEGRIEQLHSILLEFEQLARSSLADAQPLDGEVTSAVELDDTQRAKVETDLRSRYGSNLTIRFKVDPELLGGLVIRVGDQVLDNSLRTRLSVIQRNMALS